MAPRAALIQLKPGELSARHCSRPTLGAEPGEGRRKVDRVAPRFEVPQHNPFQQQGRTPSAASRRPEKFTTHLSSRSMGSTS